MKISVVATVLNEENSLKTLLDSLVNQTIKADEIVLVDGGSTDSTIPIIKEFQKNHPQINLVQESGSIAHGRNVAVKAAKNEIIAQIDGGCVAKKDWLEKLTTPLNDQSIGLVAGYYEMVADSPFQKALAPFCGIPPHRFDPRSFLPSGRSVAFRKEAWEYVGGYSECLERAGEDTLFNYKILKAGVRIARVKDAIVYWDVPATYKSALKKFYYYAKGDAQAKIWWHPAQGIATHNIKILSIFARYLLGSMFLVFGIAFPILWLFLAFGFILYTAWSMWKMLDVVHDLEARLYVPIIQVSSDLTVMAGFATGLASNRKPTTSEAVAY